MSTVDFHPNLVRGHLRFFEDMASGGNWHEITIWVKENLINENPNIKQININSFFEAGKEFIRGCIFVGNFNKIKPFCDAVDNAEFDKSNLRYKKVKLNQCKVLADGIKLAERLLKGNSAGYEDLSILLQSKRDELKSLDLEEGEKNFRDKALSTSIDAALTIVQMHCVGSSSSMGK